MSKFGWRSLNAEALLSVKPSELISFVSNRSVRNLRLVTHYHWPVRFICFLTNKITLAQVVSARHWSNLNWSHTFVSTQFNVVLIQWLFSLQLACRNWRKHYFWAIILFRRACRDSSLDPWGCPSLQNIKVDCIRYFSTHIERSTIKNSH